MNNYDKMQIIDGARLLRKHGFPFLMPIIKSLSGETAQVVEDSIRTLINNHVEVKYDRMLKEMNFYIEKRELKNLLWELIERDFIKKGQPREEIALEWLKKTYLGVDWNDNVSYDDEYGGVDIKASNPNIGVSVKGMPFRYDKKLYKHYQQLIDNDFELNMILFVDEKTKKVIGKMVKHG